MKQAHGETSASYPKTSLSKLEKRREKKSNGLDNAATESNQILLNDGKSVVSLQEYKTLEMERNSLLQEKQNWIEKMNRDNEKLAKILKVFLCTDSHSNVYLCDSVRMFHQRRRL
jgi:hypothetical protein